MHTLLNENVRQFWALDVVFYQLAVDILLVGFCETSIFSASVLTIVINFAFVTADGHVLSLRF